MLQSCFNLTHLKNGSNILGKTLFSNHSVWPIFNLNNSKRNLVNKSLYEDEMLIGFGTGVESDSRLIEGEFIFSVINASFRLE